MGKESLKLKLKNKIEPDFMRIHIKILYYLRRGPASCNFM